MISALACCFFRKMAGYGQKVREKMFLAIQLTHCGKTKNKTGGNH
ncbi:MAG: hypothetical protein OXC72_06135 [Roseovarius sp.]|nr:hypothetical protein [Roseovarius sp.]